MDVVPNKPLERILSRRSLIRGPLRAAACWSIASTVLLLLLLLNFELILGLCIDRGRIDVLLPPTEVERFEKIVDQPVTSSPDPAVPATDAPAVPIPVILDEQGILPEVWQSRDVWWGPFLAGLYRRVAWLQSNTLALIWLLSSGAFFFILRNVCLRMIRSRCHRAALDAVNATRRNVHRQVLRLGPEDVDGTGYGIASQLFTDEVEAIRDALYESMSRLIRYPLELLGLAVVLFSLNWQLAWQWIAPATLVILLVDNVHKSAIQRHRLAADRSRDELNSLLSSLKNARLTRGLGLEKTEHEQFQRHLDRFHAQLLSKMRAEDLVTHVHPTLVIACVGLLAFLIFLIGANVLTTGNNPISQRLTMAEALTFIIAAFMAIPGIRALRALPEYRRTLALSGDKIQRYLDRIPSVSQAVGAKFLQPMSKTLHFDGVKYSTSEGRKILDGVDFKLQVDKAYAIVSIDPLEAKTVALMLPRFIEPQNGRVIIDGEDIAWVTLESLRAETVFVAANDPPLDGTVFENIQGGNSDLSLQQVTEAAKLTHAHNFIVKLFNGYETMLSSRGDTLDPGQRFRLNLTRAIARNPALLVIEEPTEALDEDTKTLLIDAYERICHNRTVIFLPSRMSTIRRTDQILVLHEGKLAAMGPHSKLVTQSPIYRHWEYIHFNEFRHDGRTE